MDVGERVGHLFRALLEGDSDLYIGARHGEGVPVIARAGQFHLISFGVGDGERVKFVVLIRPHRDSDDIALVGAATVSYTHLDVYKRQRKTWSARL